MGKKYVGGKVGLDVWERLKAAANRLDLTLAQIVRRAVMEWLERNEPTQ